MSQNSRNRDKEMAAHLKAIHHVRTTANCPICHRLSALSNLANHIRVCSGR